MRPRFAAAAVLAVIAVVTALQLWSPSRIDAVDRPFHAGDEIAQQVGGPVCPDGPVGLQVRTGQQAPVVLAADGTRTLSCIYEFPTDNGSQAARASITLDWNESRITSSFMAVCGAEEHVLRLSNRTNGTLHGPGVSAMVAYSSEPEFGPRIRELATSLLGAVQDSAYPCQDGGATFGGPSDAPTGGEAAQQEGGESGCALYGRVSDALGAPVTGIRLRLTYLGQRVQLDQATDENGMYRFESVDAPEVIVTLFTEEFAHTPQRFRIHYQQQVGALSYVMSDVRMRDGDCEVNFAVDQLGEGYIVHGPALELWPDIIEIYQNVQKAWKLADLADVQLDYGLPLNVYAWCNDPSLQCSRTHSVKFAFYSGSTPGRTVDRPYFALGHPNSLRDASGTPDNREYHEFGHVFLTDLFGNEAPVFAGDVNHGGYYANRSTTDSWFEGFAEFYSLMVSKHIDVEPAPERYEIGAEYDLEVDHKAWEAAGWWEEFTVAGLLLDFEDGDDDYGSRRIDEDGLTVEQAIRFEARTGQFVIGRARNQGDAVSPNSQVVVYLYDQSGKQVFAQPTVVVPATLKPGQHGVFYASVPPGTEFSSIDVDPGGLARTDDDPIDVDLSDLIEAVGDWRGVDGRHITNVADLHRALSDYFVDRDRNGDGTIDATQDEVDQLFVSHGLFEDLDGDRAYRKGADGQVGLTSHPGRVIGDRSYPGLAPRQHAEPYPGSIITLDSGGRVTDAVVQVSYAEPHQGLGYAFAMAVDEGGQVELAVPPDGYESSVTVISLADGHHPEVAFRIDSSDYHRQIEQRPGESFLSADVELRRGEALPPVSAGSDSGNGDSSGSSDSSTDGSTTGQPRLTTQGDMQSVWVALGAGLAAVAVIVWLTFRSRGRRRLLR